MITAEGRQVAHIKLDVKALKMVILSARYRCMDEILTISSFMTVKNSLFISDDNANSQFSTQGCDYFTYLNVMKTWR